MKHPRRGEEMGFMEKSIEDGGGAINARSATRQDSWVDAAITLLATIVFGLGWTLVELERADPPLNRYARAVSTCVIWQKNMRPTGGTWQTISKI